MKTSELIGPALDWAVDMCEAGAQFASDYRKYSTDWAQGGPIIEREKIMIEAPDKEHTEWSGYLSDKDDMGIGYWDGPTPLIAAMRCYCASKLGDEVEIPEELMKG